MSHVHGNERKQHMYNGPIKTVDEVRYLIDDPATEYRYKGIMYAYLAERACSYEEEWFKGEEFLIEQANPYEKALIVDHHLESNEPYGCILCPISELRRQFGTNWKWDEPDAFDLAIESGLQDPDLVKHENYPSDVFVFIDHSDRAGGMSGESDDMLTEYRIDGDGNILEKIEDYLG